MGTPTYWLDLFTGTTWQEFIAAGGEVSGFRESRWKTVQQLKPGDCLLCYLTGLSRWIGALEVVSSAFKDDSPVWKDEAFPCRVRVKVVVSLTPETGVPILEFQDRLSIFRNLASPVQWTGHVRGSPMKWKAEDGEVVLQALREASRHPVARPFNPARLARWPQAFKAKHGPVTVLESEEPRERRPPRKEAAAHTEIQWTLAELGNDLGLGVWIARNDRGREYAGHRFAELSRLTSELPLQFDEATNRTVELIDVLRLSDLIAMQPNLNIPLYLVAPDERREKVFSEVNRPTFSRLAPPMAKMCRFLPFSALREHLAQFRPVIGHLKPSFLDELSESCDIASP